ncbi:hypothetical protein E2C01_080316 [Portunus trituberculatus]|uniref:Uncharacterized protein n=1 Tax=Portunus trituberculatus TaxID=210409 RepID=A0A5B7ISW3_PORTR|nr:hypothetical protein [Portunus trituberculatus]
MATYRRINQLFGSEAWWVRPSRRHVGPRMRIKTHASRHLVLNVETRRVGGNDTSSCAPIACH